MTFRVYPSSVRLLLCTIAFIPLVLNSQSYHEVASWGGTGGGEGLFRAPVGIATNQTGDIFVVDVENARVQKFTANGEFVTMWGKKGSSLGEFQMPRSLAVDRAGNVYVADESRRVQKFSSAGMYLGVFPVTGTGVAAAMDGSIYVIGDTVSKLDTQGNVIARFGCSGFSIAVDDSGYIYTLGGMGYRTPGQDSLIIRRFTSDGKVVNSWKRGPLCCSWGYASYIAVDSSSYVYVGSPSESLLLKYSATGSLLTQFPVDGVAGVCIAPSGNLLLTQGQWSFRVSVLTKQGAVVKTWGKFGGQGDGHFSSAMGLVVDSTRGYVYVVDLGDRRVQRFSSDGTFLRKWGTYGSSLGQFLDPSGIAIDKDGNVYISDRYSIQRFDSTGFPYSQLIGLSRAWPIAVSKNGFIYVVDESGKMNKATQSGSVVLRWGSAGTGDGQFNGIRGIGVDPSGNVYVVDTGSDEYGRMQKFDSAGAFLGKWKLEKNQETGRLRLSSVCFDGAGNLFVSDDGTGTVSKFTYDGFLLARWSCQFGLGGGVGVNRDGTVFVTSSWESGNSRVHFFKPQAPTLMGSLDCGQAGIGDSVQKTLSIVNPFPNQLTAWTLLTGTSAFRSARVGPFTVAANGSFSIDLWVKAGTFGVVADTLSLYSDLGLIKYPLKITVPYPSLDLVASLLQFGDVAKTISTTKNVVLRNSALSQLTIDSIYTLSRWFRSTATRAIIGGLGSLVLQITFTPDSLGQFGDTLVILSNSQNRVTRVALNGNCPPPLLSPSSSDLRLSSAAVGDSSSANLTIHNKSVNALTVTGVRNASSVFVAFITTPRTINANDSATVRLTFKPTMFGDFADTLTISSDGGTAKVALNGTSPHPLLSRDRSVVDFGDVPKGTVRSQTLVIRNLSINILVIDSATTQTRWFGALLQKQTITSTDSLSLPLYFMPDSLRTFTDTLLLYSNSAIRVVKVPLLGNSPRPILTASSLVLSLPQAAVGDSITRSVWLYNKTPNVITVSGISNVSQLFSTPRGAPFQVNGFDSADVKLTFKPKAFGDATDLFTIVSDGGTLKVLVSGTSPYPYLVLCQPRLDFGVLPKDSTRKLTVTIVDTSINALRLDTLYTKTKHFRVPFQKNPATVKKGDSLNYVVTFNPDSARIFTDTVFVLSNSLFGIAKIGLRGEGTMVITSIQGAALPSRFVLFQNYPNPFNPSTIIAFDIPKRVDVSLKIIDLLGQVVATLIEGTREPGHYNLQWDSTVPSGIYFYRLQAGDFVETKKMILLR